MLDNPGAWITVTARRKAIDRLRRERAIADRVARLAELARLDAPPTACRTAPSCRIGCAGARGSLPDLQRGLRAPEGDRLVRGELCGEAIRLARLLATLMPDDADVRGQLALLLLHDAHRGRASPRSTPPGAGHPSPIVDLNHAVAVARADGSHAGLALVAPLLADSRLMDYQPLRAAQADLLRRPGDLAAAAAA